MTHCGPAEVTASTRHLGPWNEVGAVSPFSTNASAAGGAPLQVAASAEGSSSGGRPRGSRPRGGGVAGHLQQVRADRVEPVVVGQPLVAVERRAASSPAPARRTIATATAWLSVTIGFRRDPLEQPVEREDLRPVGVLARRRASACTAAIAACSWYGPSGAARQRVRDQRDALGDQRAVPQRAVLLGQRDQRAVRRRCAPRRRASVSSISASSPATSPSSGSSRCSSAGQPDRLARSARRGAGPARSWRCSPR